MNAPSPKRVAFITVGRSDYGIQRPIVQRMMTDDRFEPGLFVTGAHFSPVFGQTVEEVRADGFPVLAEHPVDYGSQRPCDIISAIAQQIDGMARAFGELSDSKRPDLVFLMGDRFEMLAAACALAPLNIGLVHVHGGELSHGAVDDAMRHAITKLSHFHFTSTEEAARRVRQMGEEDWRVTVSGAPGLDNLKQFGGIGADELAAAIGLKEIAKEKPFIVTVHSETRGGVGPDRLAGAAIDALQQFDDPVVVTHPNADTGGKVIAQRLEAFCESRANAVFVKNLGTDQYFSLLASASIMIGNSSSGLIEAPSFGLPVVNIGGRQRGRTRGENVVDCLAEPDAIANGIRLATSITFRARAGRAPNPYGDGDAARRIVETLARIEIDDRFLAKEFVDR